MSQEGSSSPQGKQEPLTLPTFLSITLLATCYVPSSAGTIGGQKDGTLVPLKLIFYFWETGWLAQ